MGGGRGLKEERGAVSEVLSACLGAGWWWFGGRHGAERGGLDEVWLAEGLAVFKKKSDGGTLPVFHHSAPNCIFARFCTTSILQSFSLSDDALWLRHK